MEDSKKSTNWNEDDFKNIYEDYTKMPMCSEKIVLKLIYNLHKKNSNETKEDMEMLEKRLKFEDMNTDSNENILNELKGYLKISDAKSSTDILKQLLSRLRDLNIQEIIRITRNNDEAIDFIKGKNIYILFGLTGSGKSTTLHFLGGSKMLVLPDQKNHIAPTEITNPYLQRVKTSSSMCSETRSIIPVKIRNQNINKDVIICDSPGFEDTNGPEIDITNSNAIQKAIETCSGIKPIIVISKLYGDRYERLAILSQVLVDMISNTDLFNKFSFIFTKYSLDENDAIVDTLEGIQKSFNEIEADPKRIIDKSFKLIVDVAYNKSGENPIIIDPLNEKCVPDKILRSLCKDDFILNPSRNFKVSYSDKTKQILEKQLKKHFEFLEKSLERNEYELASYKFNELIVLKEILKQKDLEEKFGEISQNLASNLNKENKQKSSYFDRKVSQNELLNEDDINQYLTCLNNAKEAENIFLKLNCANLKKFYDFKKDFLDKVDSILINFKEKDIENQCDSIKVDLDNLKLIYEFVSSKLIDEKEKEFIDSLRKNYQDAREIISKKANKDNDSNKNLSSCNDFNRKAKILSEMSKYEKIFGQHLTGEIVLYKTIIKEVTENFEKLFEESKNLFKEPLNEHAYKRIDQIEIYFGSAKRNLNLHQHIEFDLINTHYSNFFKEYSNFFDSIKNEIIENEDLFSESVQVCLEKLELLRINDALRARSDESYNEILKKLITEFQTKKQKLNDNLDKVFKQNNENLRRIEQSLKNKRVDNLVDLKQIIELINKLDGLEPLSEVFKELSDRIKNQKDLFKECIKTQIESINKIYANLEQVKEANFQIDYESYQIYNDFLSACDQINPVYLNENFNLTKTKLKSYLSTRLNYIKDSFEKFLEQINSFEQKYESEQNEESKKVAKLIKELKSIQKDYPKLFSNGNLLSPDTLENWRRKLTAKHLHLEMEIKDSIKEKSVNKELILNRLALIKILSNLDEFLENEKSFLILHGTYFGESKGKSREIFENCKELINKNDFKGLADELINFTESDQSDKYYLTRLKRNFNDSLQEMLDEAKKNAKKLSSDDQETKIKQIDSILKKFREAKKCLSDYIDPNELGRYNILVEDIKTLTKVFIKTNLEEYEKHIEDLNINDADKILETISKCLSEYLEDDELLKIINAKKKDKNKDLEAKILKFSDIKIEDYALNSPKDLLDRLKDDKKIIKTAEFHLLKFINTKYEDELKKAEAITPLDLENNEHYELCEKNISNLPDDFKDKIIKKIEHSKQTLKKTKLENDLNLQKNIQNLDYENLLKNYNSYLDNNETKLIEKIEKFILERSFSIFQDLNQSLTDKKFDDLMNQYDEFNKLKNTFSSKICKINEEYEKFLGSLKSSYDDSKNKLEKVLDNKDKINFKTINTMFTDQLKQNYYTILYLTNFFDKNKFPDSNNFKNSLKQLNLNLYKFIASWQSVHKVIDKAVDLKNFFFDIDLVKFVLNLTDAYDYILNKNPDFGNDSLMVDLNNKDNTNRVPQTEKNVQIMNYLDIKDFFKNKIIKFRDTFCSIELMDDTRNKFETDFDNFFKNYNAKYETIKNINDNFKDIYPDLDIVTDSTNDLENRMNKLLDEGKDCLDNILNKSISYADVNKFLSAFFNFKAFVKTFSLKAKLTDPEFEKSSKRKIEPKIDELLQSIENKDLNDATNCFIRVKELSNKLIPLKKIIDDKLDTALNSYISKCGGFETMGKLALELKRSSIGNLILTEHNCFELHHRAIFNTKTSNRKIENVIEEIKGTFFDPSCKDSQNEKDKKDIDKKTLKKLFETFKEKYDSLIEEYLENDVKFNEFRGNLNSIAKRIKVDQKNIKWDDYIEEELPNLIAHIFGLWTLMNAKDYFKIKSPKDQKDKYLFVPHPAQVIAIFRLLSCGYCSGSYIYNFLSSKIMKESFFRQNYLNHNLIQIGTGEGKSVTLAVTSVILSLLGFDVYCVCYSEYLSKRDYNAFKSLFNDLNLLEQIHYGTFSQICEEFINEHGDLRKIVNDMILNNKLVISAKSSKTERPKILLIDEVDVFFSKDFYGNSYNPSVYLFDQTITDLINFIWNQRNNSISLKKLAETNEYRNCCEKFGEWKDLVKEACKDMINDLKTFESHDYVVKDDKIGYKEQDNIVFDTSYGYKTLFAYFKENSNGNISKQSLNENISILLRLGSFSYAEIPKEFVAILGVTGTLETLNRNQKKIIEDIYNIKLKTYVPSVYGRNNLRFDKSSDLFVENEENYFKVLSSEIHKRISGTNQGTKRAVFVFFNSKKELLEFYNNEEFAKFKIECSILTEEANLEEKSIIISNATTSGKITFFTKIFGRGTDFITHDEIVSNNGGIHVIQTFLSDERSEEKQIKGRTARQGEDGSYSLIISQKSLEKFLNLNELDEQIQNNLKNLYDYLDKTRNDKSELEHNENIKFAETIKTKHDVSTKFIKNLIANDKKLVKSFLLNENRGVGLYSKSKTLILMDATVSMSNLITKTKQTVQTMFERVFEILKEKNIDQDSFQIKMAVYRNYNSSKDLILQTSSWENKPDNLVHFLSKIYTEGGWGNEAIEIGLWQANQEVDLSQVVLIGDASANTKSEVESKRMDGKEKWSETRFSVPTFFLEEIEKLKSKDIPVHAFYVHANAKVNFEEIARETKGKSGYLDINSSNGSETLIKLITCEVLENIGGKELVNAYITRYRSF